MQIIKHAVLEYILCFGFAVFPGKYCTKENELSLVDVTSSIGAPLITLKDCTKTTFCPQKELLNKRFCVIF